MKKKEVKIVLMIMCIRYEFWLRGSLSIYYFTEVPVHAAFKVCSDRIAINSFDCNDIISLALLSVHYCSWFSISEMWLTFAFATDSKFRHVLNRLKVPVTIDPTILFFER